MYTGKKIGYHVLNMVYLVLHPKNFMSNSLLEARQ